MVEYGWVWHGPWLVTADLTTRWVWSSSRSTLGWCSKSRTAKTSRGATRDSQLLIQSLQQKAKWQEMTRNEEDEKNDCLLTDLCLLEQYFKPNIQNVWFFKLCQFQRLGVWRQRNKEREPSSANPSRSHGSASSLTWLGASKHPTLILAVRRRPCYGSTSNEWRESPLTCLTFLESLPVANLCM